MNLIIEQGNTSTKIGIYEKEKLEASYIYKDLDSVSLDFLFNTYNLQAGILSSVINTPESLIATLHERLKQFMIFDEKISLPIKIEYTTPDTLGKDRLAAVVGAYSLQPDKTSLVIDAGTAITYELVESPGIYKGGNISPGMTTRFKALNNYTSQLPLVKETDNIPDIGTSTITAIQAGVVKGIIYEMDGYINDFRAKYSDLFVFLTGGHSFYFERRLKNSIFADINLVLTGLNTILESNVEN